MDNLMQFTLLSVCIKVGNIANIWEEQGHFSLSSIFYWGYAWWSISILSLQKGYETDSACGKQSSKVHLLCPGGN